MNLYKKLFNNKNNKFYNKTNNKKSSYKKI